MRRLVEALGYAALAAAAVALGIVVERRRPGGSRYAWAQVDELIRALENRSVTPLQSRSRRARREARPGGPLC